MWQIGYMVSKRARLLYHLLSKGRDGKTWLVSEGRQQWGQMDLMLLDLSHGITLGSLLSSCLSKEHPHFSTQTWQKLC